MHPTGPVESATKTTRAICDYGWLVESKGSSTVLIREMHWRRCTMMEPRSLRNVCPLRLAVMSPVRVLDTIRFPYGGKDGYYGVPRRHSFEVNAPRSCLSGPLRCHPLIGTWAMVAFNAESDCKCYREGPRVSCTTHQSGVNSRDA